MKKNLLTIAVTLFLAGAFWALPATAKVRGPCSDCHTMHNTDSNGTAINGNVPQRALTKGGCVGCHTGTNTASIGTDDQPIPYVMQTTAPTYGPDYTAAGALSNAGNTLAGGNFYWVAASGDGDDTMGHNVVTEGLCTADATLVNGNTPPGFVSGWGTAGIGATWASNQLTCAGTYGCHGSHTYADDFADISGAHHADDSAGIDGSTVGKSFRFCYKILGKEYNTGGNAWEFQPTALAHNQYKGYDRTSAEAEPLIGSTSGGDTINFFCGECHGLYHSSATGDTAATDEAGGVAQSSPIAQDPWLRHPSDYDMGNTIANSEYRSYADMSGNTGTNAYNPVAPVASAVVTAVLSSISFDNDTAIVNCISCHRAHGSPYADLLRWDYQYMIAGAGTPDGWNNKGCFACHTTKDNG